MNGKKGSLVLAVLLLMVLLLSSCGGTTPAAETAEATRLSFKSASTYDELKKLNNSQVTINGYLATSSPADGSFIFLMNMPYQNCPFCVPNTSQLSNTMEVYPKQGKTFSYTTQAVRVTGKLEVAPSETEYFTDPYGYEFNFRIVDADYAIIQDSEMSEEIAAWQKIANSGVINTMYSMYDYVNFTVSWPDYFVNSYQDDKGETHPGYFLYAADAIHYLTEDGSQWNYGYQRDYFTNIIATLKGMNLKALDPLIRNVEKAEQLARKAEQELMDGQYTNTYQYVEKFGTEDYIYTLNNGPALQAEMDDLYYEFSNWLATWEV